MPEDCVTGLQGLVGVFMGWVYTRKIGGAEEKAGDEEGDNIGDEDDEESSKKDQGIELTLHTLIQLWLLGHHLVAPMFQNHVMDIMMKRHSRSPEDKTSTEKNKEKKQDGSHGRTRRGTKDVHGGGGCLPYYYSPPAAPISPPKPLITVVGEVKPDAKPAPKKIKPDAPELQDAVLELEYVYANTSISTMEAYKPHPLRQALVSLVILNSDLGQLRHSHALWPKVALADLVAEFWSEHVDRSKTRGVVEGKRGGCELHLHGKGEVCKESDDLMTSGKESTEGEDEDASGPDDHLNFEIDG